MFFTLIDSSVDRIQSEIEANPDNGSYTVALNKCWHILKTLIGHQGFVDKNMERVEVSLKPLLVYINHSQTLPFEDDLISTITGLIKKSSKISDTMKEIFPYLKNVLEKNKFITAEFYNLVEAYVRTEKAWVINNIDVVKEIVGFGIISIMTHNRDFNAENVFACVYLQQVILLVKDSPHIGQVVHDVIEQLIIRLHNKPMSHVLKRCILQTFLACFVANYEASQASLEETESFVDVFEQIIKKNPRAMKLRYEKKMFVLSMCSVLLASNVNEFVQGNVAHILKKILLVLESVKKHEEKLAIKREERQF